MKKNLRTGKVFVDWSQNDEHKTTIAVYSLRAREHPTVSTPVTWDEVEKCLKKKDAGLLVFETTDVIKRVEKMGDLFEPVLELKQKLPSVKASAVSPVQEVRSMEIAAQADGDHSSGRTIKARSAKKAESSKPKSAKSKKKSTV